MAYRIEKDWTTAAGLRAVVAAMDMGHRCGYVGVPPKHPLHGVKYNEPSAWLKPMREGDEVGKRGVMTLLIAALSEDDADRMRSPDMVFDVHGSLTFSDSDGKYPVESDLWWFGYDCGHAGDERDPALMSEAHRKIYKRYPRSFHDGVIRSLDYCISECESLARQIVEKVQP